MFDAEEVIDDLEALVALGVVGAREVHELLVLAASVVAEEGEDLQDRRRGAVERELVAEDGELLDVLRQALRQVRAVRVQRRRCVCVFGRGIVRRRRLSERRRGRCMRG